MARPGVGWLVVGVFVAVHLLGALLLMGGLEDEGSDLLDSEVKKLKGGSDGLRELIVDNEFSPSEQHSDIGIVDHAVARQSSIEESDEYVQTLLHKVILSPIERNALITVLVSQLHMAHGYLLEQKDSVLQETAERYFRSVNFLEAQEEPVLTAQDLAASASLRERLVASLHLKTHQALPLLRHSTDAELLSRAAIYKVYHGPPFGGLRQDRHRHGQAVTDEEVYDPAYFRQSVLAGIVHQTLLELMRETMIIHRLTGIRFFLMHEALLGWHRSRTLLPWSRTLVLGMLDKDLVELEAFGQWWHNDRTELRVNYQSASRLPGPASEAYDAKLINKSNGCFLAITALTNTHNSNFPSHIQPQTVPTKVSRVTLHDKMPNLYNEQDIQPLVPTRLDKDIIIFRPQHVGNVLRQEYGDEPLLQTTWGSYSWDPVLTDWVQAPSHFRYALPTATGPGK